MKKNREHNAPGFFNFCQRQYWIYMKSCGEFKSPVEIFNEKNI